MSPHNFQATIDHLLTLFREGNVPEALAHATYPRFDVPSANWSFRNRLIILLQGTEDARGFKQWKQVGRHVKKGAKSIQILAPVIQCILRCPRSECDAPHFVKRDEKPPSRCALCGISMSDEKIHQSVRAYMVIPVFRREDTEGEPLEDEKIPIPEHNLMALAEKWGITVKSHGFNGASFGSYSHGQKTILLSSPDPEIFYHELAHAAHARITKLKPGQDPKQEIVAEFVAATLSHLDGRTRHLGTSYEYLESYAERMKSDVQGAVLSLLGEIEKVLQLILTSAEAM